MQTQQVLNDLKYEPEQTMARVFTEHRPALRRLIAGRLDSRVRGRVDPSDVIQETLLDACQRLSEYLANPSVPFLSWLFALAEQNAITAHRRHVVAQKRSTRREQLLDQSGSVVPNDLQRHVISDFTDPGDRCVKQERMTQLQKAISMLNLQSQLVVRMRFMEGKTLAEIAAELDISVDAVAKRAMRSLLKLSEFAAELGLEDSD